MQPPPMMTMSAERRMGGGGSSGSGFRVQGAGFAAVLGSGVPGSGFWFRVRGSGFGTSHADSASMIARHYRELDCWQLSNELKQRIYAFLATTPAKNDFDFCKQI